MGALLESLSSYDTNMMLGAIIFLLLVIVFVVLLQVYAKWFLSRTGHLRRAPPAVTRLNVLPSSSSSSRPYMTPSKGVEASAIASIPLFVYSKQASDEDEECAICLSGFQEGEAGRRLAGCGHGFHVACIDTWLRSNSTCPVCRAPPVLGKEHDPIGAEEEEAVLVLEGVVVVTNGINASSSSSSSSASILYVPNNNSSSSSSSSSSSLGSSLKRMLSRNRSESSKVFPTSSANAVQDQLEVNS